MAVRLSLGMRKGLAVRGRNISKSAGPSGYGVSTLRGVQLVTARRVEQAQNMNGREATSDASDSRGGGGGRVATCDGG